jgi:hypothetical protein
VEMFRRGGICLLGYQFCSFLQFFLLDCDGNVQTGWYLFVRVSILTFSKIFPLDCGVNVQTGWYLFVMVFFFLPFLRFFHTIVVEMFRRGGICLLRNQFCPFLRFFYWIVVELFRRGGICLLR